MALMYETMCTLHVCSLYLLSLVGHKYLLPHYPPLWMAAPHDKKHYIDLMSDVQFFIGTEIFRITASAVRRLR